MNSHPFGYPSGQELLILTVRSAIRRMDAGKRPAPDPGSGAFGAGNSEVLSPGSLVRKGGGHGLWGSMNPWPCRWHTPRGRVQ